jgi:hypothetical protein
LILLIIENIIKVINIEILWRTLRVFVLSLFHIHSCETSWGLIRSIA